MNSRPLPGMRSKLAAFLPPAALESLTPTLLGMERLLHAGASRPAEQGELDGFDGIDQRGTPDRLLVSQWLLATEEPDEFVRRYAERELAYLKPSHREPRQRPVQDVWFDTGPSQLGAPRLAHLAALLILSSRAEQAGAAFRWRTLHSSRWRPAETESDLRTFMDARSWHPSQPILEPDPERETLFITGPDTTLPRSALRSAQLTIADGEEPLTVTAHFRRANGTSLPRQTLALPDRATSVQLLRNPIHSAPTAKGADRDGGDTQLRFVKGPVFDQSTGKLIIELERNSLELHPSPSQPGDRAGPVRRVWVRDDGQIIAAGRIRKDVVAMCLNDARNVVTMHTLKGNAWTSASFDYADDQPFTIPENELGQIENHYSHYITVRFMGGSLTIDKGELSLGAAWRPFEISVEGRSATVLRPGVGSWQGPTEETFVPIGDVIAADNVLEIDEITHAATVSANNNVVGLVLEDGTVQSIRLRDNAILYSSRKPVML